MSIVTRLQSAGLRATPKRIAIGGLLFDGVDRHVTADDVAIIARKAGVQVSLATVYNTLNPLTDAGLSTEIFAVDGEPTIEDAIAGVAGARDHAAQVFDQRRLLRRA